jgi:hypothetical protein
VTEHRFIGRSGDLLIAEDGTQVRVAPNFCTYDVPELEYSGTHAELLEFCQILDEEGLVPEWMARDKYDNWSLRIDDCLVHFGSKNLALEVKTFVKWCKMHDIQLAHKATKKRKSDESDTTSTKKRKVIQLEIINPPRAWIMETNYRKNPSFV